MKKHNRASIGWLGHALTALAVFIFIAGCIIIGFIAWVLSTSVSIQKFQSGTLILTYIVIGIGFSLFFTGLIGWVAGASETACIIRLFIVMVLVTVTSGIGGVLALQITRIETEDILRFGWMEVNQNSRNFIQSSLNCCGLKGPREFADNNYLMDSTCYEITHGEKRLKQASCSLELRRWLENNKSIWVSLIVALLIIQVLSVITAALSLHFLAKRNKNRRNESRTSSNRQLYDDSDNSENFRDSL
ncbi:tetraspanin-9 isoform X1 [Folsomia candida]|uniref:tetraspanin-9 isoform X1 n=1 Tax=Folsomia candida TaxID=158441 RepID=UPI000B8F2285|nr:tetraspanin-9 isoform X1 [Folsomia candida]